MGNETNTHRRRFLQSTGLVATGLVAGCLAGGDGGDGGDGSDGDGSTDGGSDGGDGEATGDGGDGGTTTGGAEPISIGATLPLSGPFADTAVFVRDGYRQWEQEVNDGDGLLGRQVELTIEDDQSEPAQGVSLLKRLINQQDVDLVLGGYPGSTAAGQMQVADQNGMVYVSMGGHMSSFEQGFEYTFGAPPLMGQWWYDGFWNWLETRPEDERPSRAAVITVDNPVGQAVYENTVSGLNRLNVPIEMDERYSLPLDSAQSLVSEAKNVEADVFVANGFFGDGVQTIQAVHDTDYRPKAVLQGVGSLTPAWEAELGDLGNYVVSGTSMHPDLPFEGVDRINDVANRTYDRESTPQYFMFGYAWAQTLDRGVRGAGSLDNTAIKDWLHENCVRTIGGEYCFDERGLPDPIEYATQVQDGTAELVWPSDVASAELVYPYGEQF
jgi:branched-chain amino acid transport system substrate-binding protein